MGQFIGWLRKNRLVLLHLGTTVLLLLAARLVADPLELYFGSRSRFVQSLQLSGFPFMTGWMVCQIGMLALWCGLAQTIAIRRLERSLVLLTLGWLSLVGFLWSGSRQLRPNLEVPLITCLGISLTFISTLVFAGAFRFQNRWRILRPEDSPQVTWQFTLFDLFRMTTVACTVFAVAAAIAQFCVPIDWEQSQMPWYYLSFLTSAIVLNFISLPLLLFGVWGLLSDVDGRFRQTAIFFNGLCLTLLGARLLFFPLVHDRPLTPLFEHLAVFLLGMLVPGLTTVWLVRRDGYRLGRSPPPQVLQDKIQES